MNSRDAWCLGPAGARKDGIVLFAPPASASTSQRNILVVAADDSSPHPRPFQFRGSWLKLSPNAGERHFQLGERVQLDRSTYVLGDAAMAGKCLGRPEQAREGEVIGLGIVRDGIQRNIEVRRVDDNEDNDASISLYPSFALVGVATGRGTTLQRSDWSSLRSAVAAAVASCNIKYDTRELVRANGLNVWSLLVPICGLSTAVSFWKQWQSERIPRISVSPNDPAPSSVALKSPRLVAKFWSCEREGCKFTQNPASMSTCKLCRKKGKEWSCRGCTAVNKVCDSVCCLCAYPRSPIHCGTWVNGANDCTMVEGANHASAAGPGSSPDAIISPSCASCEHSRPSPGTAHWSCCGASDETNIFCSFVPNKNKTPLKSPSIPTEAVVPMTSSAPTTVHTTGFDIERGKADGFSFSGDDQIAVGSDVYANGGFGYKQVYSDVTVSEAVAAVGDMWCTELEWEFKAAGTCGLGVVPGDWNVENVTTTMTSFASYCSLQSRSSPITRISLVEQQTWGW